MRFLRLSIFLLAATLAATSCSKRLSLLQVQGGYSLLSNEMKKEIRRVEKSVVGVTTKIIYEVQTFDYEMQNGNLVADASSPVRYRLKSGDAGIIREKDEKTLSGGGLVIEHDPSAGSYTILTSSHLVSPRDTTDTYYLDEHGAPTGVVFQRLIVKKVSLSVRGGSNWRVPAQLLVNNSISDIAIIVGDTEKYLAGEYLNALGYDLDLSWGDWVFMFGYPQQIKQMTGGWVSESPYRGTFAVDAVVRFGFSGGPVFALSRKKYELVFVGIIKSVPSGTVDYIAPDGTLPIGYRLTADDTQKLIVSREVVVNYGTVYCVNPKLIKRFIKAAKAPLEANGVFLHRKYYGRGT